MELLAVLIAYAGLIGVGQLLFKLASMQVISGLSDGVMSWQFVGGLLSNPRFLLACCLYAISTIVWAAVLTKVNLSLAYPIVISLSIALTVAIGAGVFAEKIPPESWAGLFFLAIGIVLISRGMV